MQEGLNEGNGVRMEKKSDGGNIKKQQMVEG